MDKYPKATRDRILDEKWLQLRIYAMMLAWERGEQAAELRLVYLGGDGDGAVHTSPCGPDDLERTEREVRQVWLEIREAVADDNFETSTGPLCGWCNFKDECPAYSPSR